MRIWEEVQALLHEDVIDVLTIRATTRLLKRAKIQPDPAPPASTGKLGDWYGNLLIVRPAQLVLCVSERTLLPVEGIPRGWWVSVRSSRPRRSGSR